jgi:hypothetical protein
VAVLCGRAGRVTAEHGGFRPGQSAGRRAWRSRRRPRRCAFIYFFRILKNNRPSPLTTLPTLHQIHHTLTYFLQPVCGNRPPFTSLPPPQVIRGKPAPQAVIVENPDTVDGPGHLGAFTPPSRFPTKIRFVRGFCMGAQGAHQCKMAVSGPGSRREHGPELRDRQGGRARRQG